MIRDIGDLKTSKSKFVITKQCNLTGEEFYVHLTNNLYHVNSVNASILSPNNVTRSYVYSYCSNGNLNKCINQNTN